LTTVAELEPSVGRVVVEDTNRPVNIHFLHVLQGAGSGATADPSTQVLSSAGNVFEGASVRGELALFPINALGNNFTSVTYTISSAVTNHYIAGLTPGASYSIKQIPSGGSQQITVSPGGGVIADPAGLLSFNNAGQTLSGAPRIVSAARSGSAIHLAGTGMGNLTYSVWANTNLAFTNWTLIGAAAADNTGNFQFTDSNASFYKQRFYRCSWP
jgi:hypothetical protein